ncbi:MAG TPA: type II secretion system F family protein [Planctomycetaceae bacterium]|nr:type II secretion system F family protein [Planctomycetaceae bacterium]
MDFTTLLPWAMFGGITFGVWALMTMFGAKESRVTERLDEIRNPTLRDKQRSKKQGVAAMIESAAPALSKALQPKTELEQNELRIRLATAGFNNPEAPQLYLAIKFSMLIVGALVGGGFGMLMYGPTQNGFTTIALAAGAGFYLPELVLKFVVSSRKQKIFLALPDALDLLVVCVEAGLGLDAALRRVTEEMGDTSAELSGEFNLCLMQLQMGRQRREVLHDLGVRTGVDDVKSLVAILIQADKFGSSIAQALRVQSDAMRVKRRQIAEEKAQKTAVQMLFPLVLFIVPGIFVVLVGPAAIRMIDQLLTEK